jgi:hypothetical protein
VTKQYATPGPRAIYPELCDSPSLGRCGLLANALFPRLIAQADDQGRLPGEPRAVLMQCLPHLSYVRVDEVEQALDELEAEGHLQRYAAGGRNLLQLVTWWRWQASQRRAYPSRWPAPRGWHDLVYGTSSSGPSTMDEAASQGPRRNAALRGTLQQVAARATGADTGACSGRARRRLRAPGAVPDRADAVPSGARAGDGPAASGAGPRGGAMTRAAEAAGGYVARIAAQRGEG